MSAFDQVDIGTNPDDMTGDPARTAFTKANSNTAKTANITEENTFLKKQTIKAATNDGSKAFIILDSTGAEVASISDAGKLVLADDVNAEHVQPLTNYKSVDGTTGYSGSLNFQDNLGVDITMVFKNGLITDIST